MQHPCRKHSFRVSAPNASCSQHEASFPQFILYMKRATVGPPPSGAWLIPGIASGFSGKIFYVTNFVKH